MDDAEIVRIMGEQHADVIKAIGDVKVELAKASAALTVRVDKLEIDAKDDRFWTNVKVYCVAPLTTAAHITAHLLGFKV